MSLFGPPGALSTGWEEARGRWGAAVAPRVMVTHGAPAAQRGTRGHCRVPQPLGQGPATGTPTLCSAVTKGQCSLPKGLDLQNAEPSGKEQTAAPDANVLQRPFGETGLLSEILLQIGFLDFKKHPNMERFRSSTLSGRSVSQDWQKNMLITHLIQRLQFGLPW